MNERKMCTCGKRRVAFKGRTVSGKVIYRSKCYKCHRPNYKATSGVWGYKKYRKNYCEDCGFVAKHICQLDIDHIDGNHKNNEVNNLRTLCANCHRLKSQMTKTWLNNGADRRLYVGPKPILA